MSNSTSVKGEGQLLRSGILLSIAGFLTGLGNYGFQMIMGRQLSKVEFGYMNTTLGFVMFLGLPLLIASNAVTHYIAHFRALGNEAGLSGLLLGCRRFLLRLTVVVSVSAVVLVKPLSDFFRFPRASLMLVAVICVIAGLWGTFASTLCQGMAWFRRLAVIGLGGVALRLSYGYLCTLRFTVAEAAASATAVAFLANLALLYWRRELVWKGATESPWGWDFARYLMAATACVGGGYCFTQGDLLVAQRYLEGEVLGYYTAAGVLARALPMVVGPLLTVLFTSRSGHREGNVVREQIRLLVLYAVGLLFGAGMLILLRDFCVRLLFGAYTPEAAAMVVRLAVTMLFVGMLQGLGMWALASRWSKVTLVYGVAGLAYWLILLGWGTSLGSLLRIMPILAGSAFAAILGAWLVAMRSARHVDVVAPGAGNGSPVL
jgi:O-antigen/teichoic acid export membrane protein